LLSCTKMSGAESSCSAAASSCASFRPESRFRSSRPGSPSRRSPPARRIAPGDAETDAPRGARLAEPQRASSLAHDRGCRGPRRAYGRSVVIYRGTFRREAVRLAHDLGLALVSPLDGLRARDLHGAQLAVVLGSS